MKSEVISKLSVPEFFRIIGLNPLHGMGLQIEAIERRQGSSTPHVIFQYEWQSADGVSREEIAQALRDAEDEIEMYLGYRLLPSWEEEEWVTPHSRNPYDVYGNRAAVQTKWGKLITPGRRAQTLLEAGATIGWSSAFGSPPVNGYEEIATVTVTVPEGTTECEVAVYHPGREGDERYRVRPIEADIVGTTATITFRRELVALLEADTSSMEFPITYPQDIIASGGNYLRPIIGTDDAHFEAEVDVYRIWNDPQHQADLLWYPPNACCNGGIGAYATQRGALTISNPDLGWMAYQPATWDADAEGFVHAANCQGRVPEAIKVYYKAGLRGDLECPDQRMTRQWAVAVAELALARLDRTICACETSYTERARIDLAKNGETTDYKATERMLDNPFGTRLGEVRAWQAVQRPGARISRSAT